MSEPERQLIFEVEQAWSRKGHDPSDTEADEDFVELLNRLIFLAHGC